MEDLSALVVGASPGMAPCFALDAQRRRKISHKRPLHHFGMATDGVARITVVVTLAVEAYVASCKRIKVMS